MTCDGGNGHKAAADAIKARALQESDKVLIINTTQSEWFSGRGPDISPEWDKYFYKGLLDLGPIATRWWDWAQRTSNTELLRIFASMRKFSSLSIPSFRYRTYNLLGEIPGIDSYSEVIFHNTQPNCLQAIISSIARYNRMVKENNQQDGRPKKKLVRYVNHFTDMPTIQAEMFTEEIAKIDFADLDDAQFELHTPPPILSESELMAVDSSSEQYDLRRHHRIRALYPKFYQDGVQTRVQFVDGPIRPEFLCRKENPALKQDGLYLQFTNEQEYTALKELFKAQLGSYDSINNAARLELNDEIEVSSLMLGSQASIDGTLGLIDEEITLARQKAPDPKIKYLFVFCGANDPKKGLVLYKQALEKAKQVNQDDNSRIKIIPLTNQSASLIADLYSLADTVITRPGGISIMEIEAVAKKAKIFIFSELGKLEKFANRLCLRSVEALKAHFSLQDSNTRLADLIAWESGNARHAQNRCRDAGGRTRVIPMNLYSYGHEQRLCRQKEKIAKLLNERNYDLAFQELSDSEPAICAYFLTGNDEGTHLACLLEIKRFNQAIIQQLEALIARYPEVKALQNGPIQTILLLNEANQMILNEIRSRTQPAEILKNIGAQIETLKSSFRLSIDAVKNLGLEKKSEILRVLIHIAYGFTNFFRWLFGVQLKSSLYASLEGVKEDFFKTLPEAVLKKIYQHPTSVVTQQVVDLRAADWEAIETVLQSKFELTPDLKQKTFIIHKSEYPNLQHDFIYCCNGVGQPSKLYALGRKLGHGASGEVVLIQDKDGANAVMKTHFPIDDGAPLNEAVLERERKCLEQTDAYLGDYKLVGQQVTIQKYVHGISFADYVVESRKGFFIKYKDFSSEERLHIALALAKGLEVCSDLNIVHGDIAPHNIMIQKASNGGIKATYINYGRAQLGSDPTLNYRPGISRYYGAPELLRAAKRYSNNNAGDHQFPYSQKSDVYSLGIMFRDFGIDKHLVAQMTAASPDDRVDLARVILSLTEQLRQVIEDEVEFSTNLMAF